MCILSLKGTIIVNAIKPTNAPSLKFCTFCKFLWQNGFVVHQITYEGVAVNNVLSSCLAKYKHMVKLLEYAVKIHAIH